MFSKLTKMLAMVLFVGGITACAEDPALIPVEPDNQPTVKEVSLMVNRNLLQFMSSRCFDKQIDTEQKPSLYVGEVTSDVGFINVKPEVVREQIFKRLQMSDGFTLVTNRKDPHDYELTASFTLYPTEVSVNYDYRVLLFKINLLNLHNKKTTVMTEMLRRHRGTGLWE